MAEITKLFTDAEAKLLASEIVDLMEKNTNKDHFDFQFDVSQGQMTDSKENTKFFIDIPKNTELDNYKKTIFSGDDSLTKEQVLKFSEEEEKQLQEFEKKVSDEIVNSHSKRLTNIIRKFVMPSSDPNIFPLDNIKVSALQITDLTAFDEESVHLIKVRKNIPQSQLQNEQNTPSVMPDLIKSRDEFGKAEGDYRYKYVEGVEFGDQYIYELYVGMFVDYSPNQKLRPVNVKQDTTEAGEN
jgi:hypothetical protein